MANKKFEELSERQQKMLRYIESYAASKGFPPTIRQIGEHTGIKSTSVVNYNLNKLMLAGYIERDQHVSRGIRMKESLPGSKVGMKRAHAAPKIGVVGYIFASQPVSVPEDGYVVDPENMIEVTPALLRGYEPEEAFALRVKGDSMIDAMIREGDIVILHRQETANNGDMVAVWLTDRNETTLKFFHKDGKQIRLQPAHPTMEPIYVDPQHCLIKGRVLSIIRGV